VCLIYLSFIYLTCTIICVFLFILCSYMYCFVYIEQIRDVHLNFLSCCFLPFRVLFFRLLFFVLSNIEKNKRNYICVNRYLTRSHGLYISYSFYLCQLLCILKYINWKLKGKICVLMIFIALIH
jgi:hypothetical protein